MEERRDDEADSLTGTQPTGENLEHETDADRDGDTEVDEGSKDSFPASDPPSY